MILWEGDAPEGHPGQPAYTCMLLYSIVVFHLSFNFLCLLLLYSIYLCGCHPSELLCWLTVIWSGAPTNSNSLGGAPTVFSFRKCCLSYESRRCSPTWTKTVQKTMARVAVRKRWAWGVVREITSANATPRRKKETFLIILTFAITFGQKNMFLLQSVSQVWLFL